MSETPASLRALAHRCRSLADDGGMDDVKAALNEIAHDYDRQADRIEKAEARARQRLENRPPPNGG
jgi:HD superfamily phosphohydrolase YqeK